MTGWEILVVLRSDSQAEALAAYGQPVHAASAQVLTFELAPTATLAELQAEPVVRWAGAEPPDAIVRDLDANERLFVEGWRSRRAGKPRRRGDGLDWDAPGRLPPDPPPEQSP